MNNLLNRIAFFCFLVGANLWVVQVNAQNFPTRTIRVINPWAAGGPTDSVARPVLQKMADALGQSIIVENRGGSSGEIGTGVVASSNPDGYTLLFATTGPNVVSPALRRDIRYDPIKSFVPISKWVDVPNVLAVRSNLPIKNLRELIEYAKANPGKLNYASTGPASTPRLAIEMLKHVAGLNIVEVPYPGVAPAIVDLVGGRVDLISVSLGNMTPFLKSGQLRGIALTTAKRSPLAPELPTVGELYPGFAVDSWFGLMAPAGTPPDIIEKLYRAGSEALKTPQIAQQMELLGAEVVDSTPQQFASDLPKEVESWSKMLKGIGP
jgi:tripartite-type tricarboxylate transporter receptor subunit TctC